MIGFAAKKYDCQYTINYVDEAGNIQAASIRFKNNVPANQFMMEMLGMIDLSIGKVNNELAPKLAQMKTEAAEKARIAVLDCSRLVKSYGCSWSAYVSAKPAV